MVLVFIISLLFLLIAGLNQFLKKTGNKTLSERFIIPAALFVVMCIVAYELKLDFLPTFIIFFFGLSIGTLIQYYDVTKD